MAKDIAIMYFTAEQPLGHRSYSKIVSHWIEEQNGMNKMFWHDSQQTLEVSLFFFGKYKRSTFLKFVGQNCGISIKLLFFMILC